MTVRNWCACSQAQKELESKREWRMTKRDWGRFKKRSRRREEADFRAQIARFSASSRRRLQGLGIVQTRSLAKRAVFRAFGFSHPLLSVSKFFSWFTVTAFVVGVLLFLGAGGPLSLGTG